MRDRVLEAVAYHGLLDPGKTEAHVRIAAERSGVSFSELTSRLDQIRGAAPRILSAWATFEASVGSDVFALERVLDVQFAMSDRRHGPTHADILAFAKKLAERGS